VIELIAHVKVEELVVVMATTGGIIFCVIACDKVAVHPFAAVTVTVYVPLLVTVNEAFVPTTTEPFDQE
jgi:uncharacterized membrane protein YccC